MSLGGLIPRDQQRIGRCLADYEAGNLTNRPNLAAPPVGDVGKRIMGVNTSGIDIPKYGVVVVQSNNEPGQAGDQIASFGDWELPDFPIDDGQWAAMPHYRVRRPMNDLMESDGQIGAGGQSIIGVALTEIPERGENPTPFTGLIQVEGWAPVWLVPGEDPEGSIRLAHALPVQGEYHMKLTNRNGMRVMLADWIAWQITERLLQPAPGAPDEDFSEGLWGLVLLNNYVQRAPLVHFQLTEELDSASAAAVILSERGQGKKRRVEMRNPITVHTWLMSDGTWRHAGGEQARGIALHDDKEDYRILDMEPEDTVPTTTTTTSTSTTTTSSTTTTTTSTTTTTTTTTTTSSTTTTTTSSTTTTTSTTTTEAPHMCTWSWAAMLQEWVIVEGCGGIGSCDPPSEPGTFDGQQEQTPCA